MMWCPEGYLRFPEFLTLASFRLREKLAAISDQPHSDKRDFDFATFSNTAVRGSITEFLERGDWSVCHHDGTLLRLNTTNLGLSILANKPMVEILSPASLYRPLIDCLPAPEDWWEENRGECFPYLNTTTGLICVSLTPEERFSLTPLTNTASADLVAYGKEIWAEAYELAKKFEGWSLCIKASEADRLLHSTMTDSEEDAFDSSGVGRPRMREEAAYHYQRIFPDGHKQAGLSWKEAIATIKEDTGQIYSLDTLKRGLRSLGN